MSDYANLPSPTRRNPPSPNLAPRTSTGRYPTRSRSEPSFRQHSPSVWSGAVGARPGARQAVRRQHLPPSSYALVICLRPSDNQAEATDAGCGFSLRPQPSFTFDVTWALYLRWNACSISPGTLRNPSSSGHTDASCSCNGVPSTSTGTHIPFCFTNEEPQHAHPHCPAAPVIHQTASACSRGRCNRSSCDAGSVRVSTHRDPRG